MVISNSSAYAASRALLQPPVQQTATQRLSRGGASTDEMHRTIATRRNKELDGLQKDPLQEALKSDIQLGNDATNALNEISTVLGRMRELATAVGNDSTANDPTLRNSLDEEFGSLKGEIKTVLDRSSGETKLFDHSSSAGTQSAFGSKVLSSTALAAESLKGVSDLSLTGVSSSDAANVLDRLKDVIKKVNHSSTDISQLSPISLARPSIPEPSVVDQKALDSEDSSFAEMIARSKEARASLDREIESSRAVGARMGASLFDLKPGLLINTQV